MMRFISLAAIALVLGTGAPASAAPPIGDLIQKLESGPDFRVRVQAALELGKSRSRSARAALENALDDENAAVRAAAAAALKVFGDDGAIPVLSRHENDPSPAVRAQIKASVTALRGGGGGAGKATDKPEVIVQVGKIRSASTSTSDDVARTSKQKLRQLPGIAVVEDTGAKDPPPRKDVPVVMVTGRVKTLEQSREGSSVVYLASIEFVLHKMPGQTIKGVVSGSARASGSIDEMADARALADLRRSALEAAIDSAVRRAPEALRAAAQ
jgi:hypothetical protein